MKGVIALLNRPMGRYIMVGGSVYVLELLVIITAEQVGATPVHAVAISFWVGLIVSFVLQKFVTFSDRRVHRRVLTSQIVAVSLLVAFNFGFTVTAAHLLKDVLPAVVIRTLTILLTTLWNFHLYKTRIFKAGEGAVY